MYLRHKVPRRHYVMEKPFQTSVLRDDGTLHLQRKFSTIVILPVLPGPLVYIEAICDLAKLLRPKSISQLAERGDLIHLSSLKVVKLDCGSRFRIQLMK